MRSLIARTSLSRHQPRLSLRNALALWRSRRALAALTEIQLRDAGISSEEAQAEAARPLWDAPASWKC